MQVHHSSKITSKGPGEDGYADTMFVLILGLFLSVASAQTPVQGRRCGDDPCWQFPDDLPPGMGSLGVTEDRALAALLCHLECLERGAEVLL